MQFTVTLYDSEGNEIEVKPGHAIVMGQHVIAQVPIDTYEAEIIYKHPIHSTRCERLVAEWGSAYNVLFPTSNGQLKRWEELNEEIHDDNA